MKMSSCVIACLLCLTGTNGVHAMTSVNTVETLEQYEHNPCYNPNNKPPLLIAVHCGDLEAVD